MTSELRDSPEMSAAPLASGLPADDADSSAAAAGAPPSELLLGSMDLPGMDADEDAE